MGIAIAVGLVYLAAGLLALCDRGQRTRGPSWFDIIATAVNGTNREARRRRRA